MKRPFLPLRAGGGDQGGGGGLGLVAVTEVAETEQQRLLAAERATGENIRGLYGLETFFAWDLQRRNR